MSKERGRTSQFFIKKREQATREAIVNVSPVLDIRKQRQISKARKIAGARGTAFRTRIFFCARRRSFDQSK
jgi:hypothetical protein